MTSTRICSAVVCALLLQSCLAAKMGTPQPDNNPSDLLARFSYDNTYVHGTEDRLSPLTCFEVYRSGRYRISRYRASGFTSGPETLRGVLTQDELAPIAKMLKMLDFDSHPGGVILQGSESFVAEIVRNEHAVRYVWVNPDHHRPFPDSAAKVIKWLGDFSPQGAVPLTVPENSPDPICPRMSDDPMQPIH